VETSDYRRVIPAIGWTIVGHRETGEIVIEKQNPPTDIRPEEYTLFHRLKEICKGTASRPDNNKVKYELQRYSSKEPFCGCAQKKFLEKP
jgi:hypothetical protein